MFTIPVDVGFRWLPQWSSSPVRSVTSGKSRKLWTPLHRMEWDIFSLCVWDRAMPRMVWLKMSFYLAFGHLSMNYSSGQSTSSLHCSLISSFLGSSTRWDGSVFPISFLLIYLHSLIGLSHWNLLALALWKVYISLALPSWFLLPVSARISERPRFRFDPGRHFFSWKVLQVNCPIFFYKKDWTWKGPSHLVFHFPGWI